jgi:hypothetical protein
MPRSKKKASRTREAFLSPEANDKLTELEPTDAELLAIGQARLRLGQQPNIGYHLPFGLLFEKTLYGFDVRRFRLIYTIGKDVEIVSVVKCNSLTG